MNHSKPKQENPNTPCEYTSYVDHHTSFKQETSRRKAQAGNSKFFNFFCVLVLFLFLYTGYTQYEVTVQKNIFLELVEEHKEGLEIKEYISARRDFIALQNSENALRLQFLGIIIAVAGACLTWFNWSSSERKQVSERFSKAIDQLAHNDIKVRSWGILTLDKISQDYPEYRDSIINSLIIYIKIESNLKTMNHSQQKTNSDIKQAFIIISKCIKTRKKQIELDLGDCCFKNLVLKDCNLFNMNFENCSFEDADLEGANLSGSKLNLVNLTGINLKHANLIGAKLNNCNSKNSKPVRADLTEADLQDTDLTGANFRNSSFSNAKLNRASVVCVNFVGADLKGADFTGARIEYTNFKNSEMDSTTKIDIKWKIIHVINIRDVIEDENFDLLDFSQAILTNSKFKTCTFQCNTCFDNSDLGDSRFEGVILKGANFKGKMTILQTCEFLDSHLPEAIFEYAIMGDIYIKGTNELANLTNSQFINKCSLESSIFERCDLTGALFEECNLKNATFQECNLTDSKFIRCNLNGVNIHEKQWEAVELQGCFDDNGNPIKKM